MSAGYQEGMPWQGERIPARLYQQETWTEHPEKTAGQSIDEQWEERRQELVARGDIFDAKGNVTQAGQDFLTKNSRWSREQVLHLERLQQNHVAPVEVIRPHVQELPGEGRMSSLKRSKIAADARARAEQALAERPAA